MELPASRVACVLMLFKISMRWPILIVSTSIIAFAFATCAASVWAARSCCCAS